MTDEKSKVTDKASEIARNIWLAGVGAGIFVVCISGFFAARGAINAAPVDVLRGAPG